MEEFAPFKSTGDHIAALTLVITDLASVLHTVAPEALERRLREVRIELQGLEGGRVSHPNADDLDHRRRRLALLERCVDESRSRIASGPGGLSPA